MSSVKIENLTDSFYLAKLAVNMRAIKTRALGSVRVRQRLGARLPLGLQHADRVGDGVGGARCGDAQDRRAAPPAALAGAWGARGRSHILLVFGHYL